MEKSPLIQGISQAAAKRPSLRRRCINPFHSSPVEWSVHVQGNCVQVRSKDRNYEIVPTAVRGAVGPFSRGAQMRMLRFLNRVDWTRLDGTLFVTLTYPDSVDVRSYKDRTVDRSRFIRYIEGHTGKHLPVVWRVEWKHRKSGAKVGQLMPHWHLLVCGVKFLAADVVRDFWRKCIGYPVGPLCTDVQLVTGELGAVRYIAKYLSKRASLDISSYLNSGFEFGRHWGVCRKGLVPMSAVTVDRKLTPEEVEFLKVYAASGGRRWSVENDVGFTVFSRDSVKIWEELAKGS